MEKCIYCKEPIKTSEPISWGVETDENGKEKGYYHFDCKFPPEEEI